LRARAATHARHVARILDLFGSVPEASVAAVQQHLQTELTRDDLASVRVLGHGGRELFALGQTPDWWLPITATYAPSAAAGYARILVTPNERLGHDLARVVGVHLLVGVVLGLGIYRIPVRAFSRAIRELESAQAQLVHADRLSALGTMYAGLAHEINNPLGILSVRVKLALAAGREKGLDADTLKDLEIVDRQSGRIAEIMRSLLAFSRKAEFSRRSCDINAVVQDVVSLVEKPFAKQGVTVEAVLAPGLPPLSASPDHLLQVLLNLVTNACDAMPGGGRIAVRTRRDDGHVVAEVQDAGPGLTEEARAHLFEPFFTTKDVGRGTGLGLSVSYGIVRAHGGELEACNPPQGGALFRMSLPVLQ
jgi:C4-dicarboxylate-specific signal transduction histidine kinase